MVTRILPGAWTVQRWEVAVELGLVGIGGAAGAIARYVVGRGLTMRFGDGFPYGTFTVNIAGAFLIGVLYVLLTERGVSDERLRLLLATGFLGGFTTFSTYTLEAITLAESGQWNVSLLYVIASNLLGLAACLAGMLAIRSIV